ncbi:MAG: hypothetical protein ACR2QM_01215 [Longimicrobiales bacterium]
MDGRTMAHWAAVFSAMLPLSCGILDAPDPNSLTYGDLGHPASAGGLVNGAEHLVAQSYGNVVRISGVMADELVSIGSFQAFGELSRGFFDDTSNQFSDGLYVDLSEAQWLVNEAVIRLDGFVADDPQDPQLRVYLSRALMLSGFLSTLIADSFVDFVVSDRGNAQPPLGPVGMRVLLVDALDQLGRSRSLAVELADEDLELRATALLARAHLTLALWDRVQPNDLTVPVLVSDPAADGFAMEVIERGGDEWEWVFTYGPTTTGPPSVRSSLGSQLQFGERYVSFDNGDPGTVTGLALVDPSTGVPDVRASAEVARFTGPSLFTDLVTTSAREMMLVLAESSLVEGDPATSADWLDRIRDIDQRGPVQRALDPLVLLQHERRVQLLLQGRRVLDHYRFGGGSDDWDAASPAVLSPGTRLPITDSELKTNPHLNGSGG